MSDYTLITGASGAIGRAVSLKLAKAGRPLFLHYHRSYEEALQLKTECEAFGVPVSLVQGNLSKRNGADELMEQLHSPVDTLIYNCGVAQYGVFQDVTEEELYDLAHLHLLNGMFLVKKLLPSMITKKHGNIILMSSIWGYRGAACEVVYSTMKGGVNAFVRSLAKETARSGIRVNALAPGVVDTPMMASFSKTERHALMEDIPSGRFAEPKEAADAVCFLISREASYINGHILDLNGAW